jgi:O-glycosyl hydrolase
MLKTISIFFTLLFYVSFAYSQTILLNFDTAGVPPTVADWKNYSQGGAAGSVWGAPNPAPGDPVNSSPGSYKITKLETDPYWTGLEVTFTNAIRITNSNQYLHVMVYKTSNSRIALTFTPQGGAQSADAWQSNSTQGEWIDYVQPITTGIDLKTIAIKIADDPGVYYFDQITLSDSPVPMSRAKVKVDPSIKFQEIEGWGASLCWWANKIGHYPDARIKLICDWIVDPVSGLNMNIFRFNIGGGDDPTHSHMRADGGDMPGYKASATSDYDWTQDEAQRKVLQQLINSRIDKAGTNDIQLVAFSNSPPYWMTRSGCSAGSFEGNVTNLRSDMFGEFADYLTEVVKYYHDSLGITFNYLEPFNEPDGEWWKAFGNQEGCYFNHSDQIRLIREVYSKLEAKQMLSYTRLTANDANSINAGFSAMNAYQNAGDILDKIDLISVHSYYGNQHTSMANFAATHGKKLWQSESGPLYVGGTDPYVLMHMSARVITDIKKLRCSAWIDWQLVGGSTIWGVIYADYQNTLAPFQRVMNYHVRAQFSRYIKPGYRIVDSTSDLSLAAISPDGSELVLVIINPETYVQQFNIDLSAFEGFGKVRQIRTRADESFNLKNSLSTFDINGSSFTYDAQPESLVTYVIPLKINTNVAEAILVQNGIQLFYSEGNLNINHAETERLQLQVYNSTGQLIISIQDVSLPARIPIKLDSGIYPVNLHDGKQRFATKLVVP